MTLFCWLFGHRFVKKDFKGTLHWAGFCLRCGKRPDDDARDFVGSLKEADEDLLAGRTTSARDLRAELGRES